MTEIHTCSYECDRPECIRAQRDELSARMAAAMSQGAEEQGGGIAELRRMVAKLAAHVRPTCGELWAEAERLLNSTAPPSAPLGVDGLIEAAKAAESMLRTVHECASHECEDCREYAGIVAKQLRAALAQQPAAVDRARFRKAPCYLCGYNGAGYFQPETHPCAALYHAAQHQEPKP